MPETTVEPQWKWRWQNLLEASGQACDILTTVFPSEHILGKLHTYENDVIPRAPGLMDKNSCSIDSNLIVRNWRP